MKRKKITSQQVADSTIPTTNPRADYVSDDTIHSSLHIRKSIEDVEVGDVLVGFSRNNEHVLWDTKYEVVNNTYPYVLVSNKKTNYYIGFDESVTHVYVKNKLAYKLRDNNGEYAEVIKKVPASDLKVGDAIIANVSMSYEPKMYVITNMDKDTNHCLVVTVLQLFDGYEYTNLFDTGRMYTVVGDYSSYIQTEVDPKVRETMEKVREKLSPYSAESALEVLIKTYSELLVKASGWESK